MSDWAKSQGKKFDRYLLQERVKQLRTNPYDLAAAKFNLPPNSPQVVRAAQPMVEEWAESNRASAYIFGDTYEGMPIDEALKVIIDENFGPVGRTPQGLIRFKHDYLGLGLTPRCDDDGNLSAIPVDVALEIRTDLVKTTDFCGLGLFDPSVQGNTLYAQMDATCGFRVKMYCLRSLASAEINQIPIS